MVKDSNELSLGGDEPVDADMTTTAEDADDDVQLESGDDDSICFRTGMGDEDEDEDEEADEDDEDEDEDFDGESDYDGGVLRRFSQQAMRRRAGGARSDDDSNDGADDDDDDDDDEVNPANILRRLIEARARQQTTTATADAPDAADSRSQEFADVIQRLMGGGMMFGGGGSSGGPGGAASGVVFDGALFGGSGGVRGEIELLMANLSQRQDPYLILELLNELSERLLMMNGITAERVIPANRLAKCLVDILQDQGLAEDLEVHLVACRCLYNFLEVNLDFIHDALNNGAVEALCGKLLEISYIDLTEQALQTLEMILRDPVLHEQIVESNGIRACLQYLDFFTVHAQRKLLTIVANACISGVNAPNLASQIQGEVFLMISNLVRLHRDPIVVENGWLAVSRIIMSVKLEAEVLEHGLFGSVEGEDLIVEMVKVIERSSSNKAASNDPEKHNRSEDNSVTFGTSLNLIRSLVVLVSVGVKVSRLLLNGRLGQLISKALAVAGSHASDHEDHHTSAKTASNTISSLMSAPKELLSQFLTLIGYLLPVAYTELPYSHGCLTSPRKVHVNEARIEMCSSTGPEAAAYTAFVNDVWLLLINSFQATMDYDIRRKVIVCLYRIVAFAQPDMKIDNLDQICGVLTSVVNHCRALRERGSKSLSVQSSMLLAVVLKICQILVDNASDSLFKRLERDGLMNDIERIEKLCLAEVESDDDDEPMNSQSAMSSTAATFTDFELTKDYESNGLDSKALERNIHSLCGCILRSYALAASSNAQTAESEIGANMRALEEALIPISNPRLVSYTFENWCEAFQQLKLAISKEGNGEISSFQLMSSGAIDALVSVLTPDSENCQRAFVEVFFEHDGVEALVGKLQECLTKSESFDIVSTNPGATNTGAISGLGTGFGGIHGAASRFGNHKTASMARQVKINLEGDDRLRSRVSIGGMQGITLSVHAIATFKSIETFVQQRLKVLEEFDDARSKFEEVLSPAANDEAKDKEDSDSGIEALGESLIEFSIKGEVIPNETTIYGAIYRSLQLQAESDDQENFNSRIWSQVHTVRFRKLHKPLEENDGPIHAIESLGVDDEPMDHDTMSILQLLNLLFDMNSVQANLHAKCISNDAFTNWKLTVKLNRQLEEPLIVASGTLPGWSITIPKKFSMVFPLETRVFFLHSTSFGYSRLIHHWQTRTNKEEENERSGSAGAGLGSATGGQPRTQLGRPARHKVRLSRKLLLQSAVKVLGMYGSTPGVLEVEYFDEVGSGLGPTLEFYSSVSKEFCHKKLLLWRDDGSDSGNEYVTNKSGLFPQPMSKQQLNSNNGKKVLVFFNVLGKFVARGMLDSRIVDFNFNHNFFKLVLLLLRDPQQQQLGFKGLSNLAVLRQIDPTLTESIKKLQEYRMAGHDLVNLGLTFELPGYPQYDLAGEAMPVTAANLDLYVQRVVEATIITGVIHQIRAFMDGFSKVFPINSLVLFSPEELISMFGGNGEEDWSPQTLTACIKADHGYTKDSPAITNFINILAEFDKLERRKLLQFLTGAPKLPIGGFKALQPELTVVKKSGEDGLKDDDYLPSVMTCANYLKLPNYSSAALMKSRLLQAINDGAGAFLLS